MLREAGVLYVEIRRDLRAQWGRIMSVFYISLLLSSALVNAYPGENKQIQDGDSVLRGHQTDVATRSNLGGSNDCDFIISESINGLPLHDQLLSTSCSEGLLSWRPPLGTISLVFTPIVTSGLRHQHIRLCILVEAFYSSVEIYKYNNNDDGNRYSTDELHFRNPPDDLTLLTTADDSDGSLEGSEICITGDDVREELVLQLKGNSGAPGGQLWGEFTMSYDVEIRETESNIITRDCKPCDDEQLLRMACSSDFITFASIHGTELDVVSARVNIAIIVQPTHILRQPIQDGGSTVHRRGISDSIQQTVMFSHEETAHVYFPSICHVQHVRHGTDEFLLMGRVRLGRPLLRCAPRKKYFLELWHRARTLEQTICKLSL